MSYAIRILSHNTFKFNYEYPFHSHIFPLPVNIMLIIYPQLIVLFSYYFLFHKLSGAIQVKFSINKISTIILPSLF